MGIKNSFYRIPLCTFSNEKKLNGRLRIKFCFQRRESNLNLTLKQRHISTLKAKSRKYQGVFEVKSRVKTWQVRGIWSQQLEHQQVPKWGTEPGVRTSQVPTLKQRQMSIFIFNVMIYLQPKQRHISMLIRFNKIE